MPTLKLILKNWRRFKKNGHDVFTALSINPRDEYPFLIYIPSANIAQTITLDKYKIIYRKFDSILSDELSDIDSNKLSISFLKLYNINHL